MKIKISILFLIISFSLLTAKELRVSGSNNAEYWLFIDENLDSANYKEHLEDKFKLSVNYGELTLKTILFLWDPSIAVKEALKYLDYAVIYNKNPVDLLYGRYYTTFGRGLVLNAYLDEDFNNDNSLYGLKADLKYYNSQLTLLSGEPRSIFFEENRYEIKNDTTDQIRGINFETKLIPKTALGARYVRINRLADLTPKAFTELYGANLGFTYGPFESYLEYARQWGSHPIIGGRLKGDGLLFTTGLALSGLGISFQYMDYDTIGFGGTGYRYNEPPTPIKAGYSVNRGLDEKGLGITINATPIEKLIGELSYNEIKTHNKEQGVVEEIIKLTSHVNENFELIGGIERLIEQGIEPGIEEKKQTKPNIDITYNFTSFYVEAGYEHNFITDNLNNYYEQTIALSIGKPPQFVFSVQYERRNRVIEYLNDEKDWPLAELSIDLTERHNLRIRVGAEKGGLVCSGGVCRYEEPFKGVKVVFTTIF